MSGGTRDTALVLVLVGAFAALVTDHVAILFGLVRRRRLAKAAGALILPPLAPYWALTHGMPVRGVAWLAVAALYAIALVLSR